MKNPKILYGVTIAAIFFGNYAFAENPSKQPDGTVDHYLFEENPDPLYWEGERQHDLENYKKAIELFRQSCENGTAGSCAVFATMYMNGEGVEIDAPKSCHYFKRSCNSGFAPACSVIASIFEEDSDCGPKDLFESRRLYRIACDVGHSSACADLGRLFENGLGGESDPIIARQLYSTACSQNNQRGCTEHARTLMFGIGGESDLITARTLFERGCANNDGVSCYQLASFHTRDDEKNVEAELYYSKARSSFRDVCLNYAENDDIDACYSYFYMVAHGEGGPEVKSATLDFFEAACGEGHQLSCDELNSLKKEID